MSHILAFCIQLFFPVSRLPFLGNKYSIFFRFDVKKGEKKGIYFKLYTQGAANSGHLFQMPSLNLSHLSGPSLGTSKCMMDYSRTYSSHFLLFPLFSIFLQIRSSSNLIRHDSSSLVRWFSNGTRERRNISESFNRCKSSSAVSNNSCRAVSPTVVTKSVSLCYPPFIA